jgi:hypothetical protein
VTFSYLSTFTYLRGVELENSTEPEPSATFAISQILNGLRHALYCESGMCGLVCPSVKLTFQKVQSVKTYQSKGKKLLLYHQISASLSIMAALFIAFRHQTEEV